MSRRLSRRLLALQGLVRPKAYYGGPVSDHFDGLRFHLPAQPRDKKLTDLLRWRFAGGRKAWPESFPSPFADKPPSTFAGLRTTLIGHASFLVQVADRNILIDPVFADRASPFGFTGPKRVNPPGIAFADLPVIHTVLLTHNHYDHLDLAALDRLWRRDRPHIVAPLGNDTIVKARHPDIAVETRDWGEAVDLGHGISAHLLPAYHWSARGLGDRRMALWCAFALTTPSGTIYHVGDTGFGDGRIFADMRERFGAPLVAHLPIGAYEPRWFMEPQHINPGDAVRVLDIVGARQALGHHWGTFRLTDEGIEEPVADLTAAMESAGIPPQRFLALRPGEVWRA